MLHTCCTHVHPCFLRLGSRILRSLKVSEKLAVAIPQGVARLVQAGTPHPPYNILPVNYSSLVLRSCKFSAPPGGQVIAMFA